MVNSIFVNEAAKRADAEEDAKMRDECSEGKDRSKMNRLIAIGEVEVAGAPFTIPACEGAAYLAGK